MAGIDQAEVRYVQNWQAHADKAAELEASGDEFQWQAADAYAEAARTATGWQIADRVGKSESHISRMIAAAQLVDRGQFVVAYSQTKAHVANNSGDNEWYTPSEYIQAARDVMGGIDLDPASSAEANDVVGAALWWAEPDNPLEQAWRGRVWMNPPYARPLIDAFCGKLAEEYSAGNVTQAITLTNNATETGWFHALAEVGAAICFPRHRVKFWHPRHPRKESIPLQGQAAMYLGEDVGAFRREFLQFGFVVTF